MPRNEDAGRNRPRPIGAIRPEFSGTPPASALHKNREAASYAALKQEWAEQVAADNELSGVAYRIALALPNWLNRKSLTAWPAQSTVAAKIGTTERNVRRGFKQLEERGHLICQNKFRGGRLANRYRIVVQGVVMEAKNDAETGQLCPVREDKVVRGEGTNLSGVTGQSEPVNPDKSVRGTPERTLEETKATPNASAGMTTDHRGPPATAEQAAAIMKEVYSAGQ